MKKKSSIFIAATDQHIGKTTTSLGLLSAFKKRGIDVGYCKPLGQEYVVYGQEHVDKDVALFAELMPFDVIPHLHSPVLTKRGMTEKYIDSPNHDELVAKIDTSAQMLREKHDTVLFEGTGHPGVGSIVGLSNADVARRINAGVILVLKGGIGNTYDRYMLCKRFFEAANAQILGVIINKIMPNKEEKVKEYLTKIFSKEKVEILGFVPHDQRLSCPLLSTIAAELNADLLTPDDQLDRLVENVVVGSLMEIGTFHPDKRYLLVVSVSRLKPALNNLQEIWRSYNNMQPNLVGVLLSGPNDPDKAELNFFVQNNITVMRTSFDTYETIQKIAHLEVKLNAKATEKISRAIDLFDEHVKIDRIVELITPK